MRDKPPRQNNAQRLDWPGGVVPDWAKPTGNGPGGPGSGKRRRGKGRGKGGGGGGAHPGHERQGGSSPSKRERLQKVMAQSGHGSRRNIEILIAQGHITINGIVAKLGDLVGPGDKVKMDGEYITLRFGEPPPRVLLYHKPEGEIVTRDDPEGRATVFEKLPKVHNGRWVSVGRLDFNTGGLLIFTTSGELANRLTHPRFEVEREYAVRLMGELTDEIRVKLLDEGVDIDGENCKFDLIEDRGGEGSNHWYHVVLREGKNREVRRMFEAVSLMVSRLMRVRFGPVTLPTFLKRGMMKEMEEAEALQLMDFCGLKQADVETTASVPAHEEDEDLQPPGISHTQTGVHSIISTLGSGGGQGGKKHRGPRQGLRGPGQHSGGGHGQGPGASGGQGPSKKFGKQKHRNKQGQPGQGQGQGQGRGRGPAQPRAPGIEPGNAAEPMQAYIAPDDALDNIGNTDRGNPQGAQQRPQWQGKRKGGGGGQQRQRAPRGDEQPRFEPGNAVEPMKAYIAPDDSLNDNLGNSERGNPQGAHQRPQWQGKRKGGGGGQPQQGKQQRQRAPRGDEQPRFNEPQEKERGDEQPQSNENRRIW
ncbi:hypothetical protein BWI17_22310 [Betaproteobacteria bacterium GR16-43]|nr:hypothetical protein BWI17_22310 [Betaproteobacteria bacterium GR16-43]